MAKEYQKTYEEYLADQREKVLVDLRKPEDAGKNPVPGAQSIFWEDIEYGDGELPESDPLYLICYTGDTSDEYAKAFTEEGREVYSIREGVRGFLRWKLTGLS